MITSLHVKGVATYDSIKGVKIDDLKKVNFFFGYNGSGKSTIARYLQTLSLGPEKQNSFFNQCTNVGYDSLQHQILVFNEDFIEENFRRSNDFRGVFSLNVSNAVIDAQIANEEQTITDYELLKNKYSEKSESAKTRPK
jgi:wobble nucleotide-excising tRNase